MICAAALFVAYLGLFVPERLDRWVTWADLPLLHANFVGALCLFGGIYMIGCILAPAVGGPPLASWARTFFRAQALVFAVVGLLLLVARGAMADLWPWPISDGLAQFYGGPLIAYAYCSWRYSERRSWAELAAIAPAMLAFTAVTVLDSLEHADLFSKSDVAAWVWFGGFGAATVALLAINAQALPAALEDRARPATAPAPAAGPDAAPPRPAGASPG